MYCKANKENVCTDYCYGHCFGCGHFAPIKEGMDMDALKKDAYERFKMRWLMSHGFTFARIVEAFSGFITELCVESEEMDVTLEELLNDRYFEDWLEEHGFNGELWPCFEEFCENEWQGTALDEGTERRACSTCPVEQCDTLNYRGSRCAALRAQAGENSDPEATSEGTYVVEVSSGVRTTITLKAESAKAAQKRVEGDMVFEQVNPEPYGDDIDSNQFSEFRVWKE